MKGRKWLGQWVGAIGVVLAVQVGVATAQLPGLPAASSPATDKSKDKGSAAGKPIAAPTADNPKATVATTSGPIRVRETVPDRAVRRTLEELLPKYPGVRSVRVGANDGVVTLEGHVVDDDTQGQVTEFVRRVEGVRLVLNRMKTDAEVLTAPQRARQALDGYGKFLAKNWLLMLLALAILLAALLAARLFNQYSDVLLAPFVRNVLLRSVVGSLVGSLLIIGGLLLALSVLHLTQAVLSILGLAGVVGLAVGFAFRDITENFIASVLLGVRRPFQVGDYVTVAGYSGVVRSLNTRATVLVTLEGNHVRIPNATIFKEILVNSSASPSTRGSFDVLIPHSASTAAALEAATAALRQQEGILPDPPPRALVEALEPAGVRLRTYYWSSTQGVDGYKLNSDAKLKVKVALQQAGIGLAPTGVFQLAVAGRVPVLVARADGHPGDEDAPHACAVLTRAQAEANLREDSRAAASARLPNGRATPAEHVLNEADARVGQEGANLLKDPA
jgi:small conductance mechanosensitive channel